MRTRLVTAAAVALGATALTAPAHATTQDECRALITVLGDDTGAALDGKVRDGLLVKADAAVTKLDAGKVADALAKLVDYDVTLHALHDARKPKVGAGDFALLDGDVHAALACVENIGDALILRLRRRASSARVEGPPAGIPRDHDLIAGSGGLT